MPHLSHSLDLSPCDFFPFDYLKDKLIDKNYTTPEDLFAEGAMIISEIPCDLISRVFAIWHQKWQKMPRYARELPSVPSGDEHLNTLKLAIKTFDIKLFFTRRTLRCLQYVDRVSPSKREKPDLW
jgi:hypothetical protein